MKDSTAVSNQWCMPVGFLGYKISFDPWYPQNKVKDHYVQIVKKKPLQNHRDYVMLLINQSADTGEKEL